MARISIFILRILGLAVLLINCDRPSCKNTNLIFENYPPDSKEYKEELAKQLAMVDKSKLTYWMDSYQEGNHSQYIIAHIQGDGLCAKIYLTIESDKGIEELLKNKGIGYRGAELTDVKFEVIQDSTSTEFIFQKAGGITD